eukprot:COSAG05_NODE_574_length_8600_cov_2.783790_5_plen_134_part_00
MQVVLLDVAKNLVDCHAGHDISKIATFVHVQVDIVGLCKQHERARRRGHIFESGAGEAPPQRLDNGAEESATLCFRSKGVRTHSESVRLHPLLPQLCAQALAPLLRAALCYATNLEIAIVGRRDRGQYCAEVG